MNFVDYSINELLRPEGFECSCGKHHVAGTRQIAIGSGVIAQLPDVLKSLGLKKPFVLADCNTWAVAGSSVCDMLGKDGIPYQSYCFPRQSLEPDEFSIGQVIVAFDATCDSIVAVGSGTVNDIGKVIASRLKIPQVIVATAPSMDGYASNSSALICGGVKSTVYTCCPVAVVADTDILAQAPMHMLRAGLGDILAKYISIAEWRISHLVNGEYYCDAIAELMRKAVRKCAEQAPKLPSRDPNAVQAVTEGLILSGIAMSFAETSRPASGLEHYFSHIWEMRALQNHKKFDLHGIQVGVGTLLARKLYTWLDGVVPSRQKALAVAAEFNMDAWEAQMRRFFGTSAESIIELERQSGKHDAKKHAVRLERILEQWPMILKIIKDEIPSFESLESIIKTAGGPIYPSEIWISPEEAAEALVASMEIRDKYIGSRLFLDIGVLDEMAGRLKKYCEAMPGNTGTQGK